MKIDIHHHLLHNRRNAMKEKPLWWEKILWKGFVWLMNRPGLYHFGLRLAPFAQQFHPLVFGTKLDPARGWTSTRDLPEAAPESFSAWMKKRKEAGK